MRETAGRRRRRPQPVREVGEPGADEAVVFVHGNPGSWHDWADLLGRVGGFARAVALDMPGFGAADKPDDVRVHGRGLRRVPRRAL